jgi:solute:Na+ symporter, SSS family
VVVLIAAYAVTVAAASCWVARGVHGPADFLMGRRGLGVAQGIGLFGGIFLAATAVGVVGQGYQRGVAGGALDLALGLGFAILGVVLLRRMRASKHASLAAVLRDHYGGVAGAIGALVVGGAWLILLAAFVAAAGIALQQLSGWSRQLCTAVSVAILLLYAMPGGMRAVTATNLAHLAVLAVLLVGVSVLAVVHAPAPTVHHPASFSWGYVVGVLLLSAPTTVVAPDVMMGIGALRTRAAAGKTLAVVVVLLACGGLALALLGARAGHLLSVANPDDALPRLIGLLLPSGLAKGGLLLLFGAALTGAVAEVVVCTFILGEQLAAWRQPLARPAHGLSAVRVQMTAIAVLAGAVALADPHVVGLVLTAFRVFVPGIVPQAVLALSGRRTAPRAVAVSMVAGPAVCLGVAWALPGLQETPADPVLWGSTVAVAVLALGRVPTSQAPRLYEH